MDIGCVCLALASDVTPVNEEAGATFPAVGFTGVHRVAALISVSFPNIICDYR